MNPNRGFTTFILVAGRPIIEYTERTDLAKGGFNSAGDRNSEAFFSGQEEESRPVSPHSNHVGLRPVTMTGIF